MTDDFVMTELRKLQLLKFFPSDPVAIVALAEMVGEWCAAEHATPDTPEERCTKLVQLALSTSQQWECPAFLREKYESLYPEHKRSSDGIDPAAEWVAPWKRHLNN